MRFVIIKEEQEVRIRGMRKLGNASTLEAPSRLCVRAVHMGTSPPHVTLIGIDQHQAFEPPVWPATVLTVQATQPSGLAADVCSDVCSRPSGRRLRREASPSSNASSARASTTIYCVGKVTYMSRPCLRAWRSGLALWTGSARPR
jgi:hypothetical protein